jgi:hypothetical protein
LGKRSSPGTAPTFGAVFCGLGDSLDYGDELHEARIAFVAQEAIDLATASVVRGVDGREDVVFHGGGAKVFEAAHDLVKAAASAFGQPEGVVDLPGAVDRDPDEELVLLEEGRPGVVQLGAVGLDRVLCPLPRLQVLVDQLDGAVEELEPHQRRLAALPCDLHDRSAGVRLDQLTDVRLEQPVGHPEAAARVQHLL